MLGLSMIMPAACAAAFLLPAEGRAQIGNWYQCSNPAVPGEVYVVPGDVARDFGAQGYYCGILDIDYTSSLQQACRRAYEIPGRAWFVYNPGVPTGWSGLSCP